MEVRRRRPPRQISVRRWRATTRRPPSRSRRRLPRRGRRRRRNDNRRPVGATPDGPVRPRRRAGPPPAGAGRRRCRVDGTAGHPVRPPRPGAGWPASTAGAARGASGPRAPSPAAATTPSRVRGGTPCRPRRRPAGPASGAASPTASGTPPGSPGPGRRGRVPGTLEETQRAEELPDRDATARDVLAVVPGVVPAAGRVEAAFAVPTGVETLGVRPVPGRHGDVAGVGRPADVAGRSGVARRKSLGDLDPGAHHGEEALRVLGQLPVEPVTHAEGVAALPRGLDDEAAAPSSQIGKLQLVDGQTGRRFRPDRPRR